MPKFISIPHIFRVSPAHKVNTVHSEVCVLPHPPNSTLTSCVPEKRPTPAEIAPGTQPTSRSAGIIHCPQIRPPALEVP